MKDDLAPVSREQLNHLLATVCQDVLFKVARAGWQYSGELYVLPDGIAFWQGSGIIKPMLIWEQLRYETVRRLEVTKDSISIAKGERASSAIAGLKRSDTYTFLKTLEALKESGKVPNSLTLVDLTQDKR